MNYNNYSYLILYQCFKRLLITNVLLSLMCTIFQFYQNIEPNIKIILFKQNATSFANLLSLFSHHPYSVNMNLTNVWQENTSNYNNNNINRWLNGPGTIRCQFECNSNETSFVFRSMYGFFDGGSALLLELRMLRSATVPFWIDWMILALCSFNCFTENLADNVGTS